MQTKETKSRTTDELITYMLQSKKEEKAKAKKFVKTKEFQEIKSKLRDLNKNVV